MWQEYAVLSVYVPSLSLEVEQIGAEGRSVVLGRHSRGAATRHVRELSLQLNEADPSKDCSSSLRGEAAESSGHSELAQALGPRTSLPPLHPGCCLSRAVPNGRMLFFPTQSALPRGGD